MSFEKELKEIVRSAMVDRDIRGIYETNTGFEIDRRLSDEAISKRGILPRTADLNLFGPEVLEVSYDDLNKLGISPKRIRQVANNSGEVL